MARLDLAAISYAQFHRNFPVCSSALTFGCLVLRGYWTGRRILRSPMYLVQSWIESSPSSTSSCPSVTLQRGLAGRSQWWSLYMVRENLPASYSGVFIGVICWAIFAFLVGAVTAPPGGGAGALMWIFTIWYMHKRDIKALVSLHKGLMWLAFIAAGIMAVIGVAQSDVITPNTIEAFIAVLLSGVVWGALHSYFSKITIGPETAIPTEIHTSSTPPSLDFAQTKTKPSCMNELDEDAIWAAAANELEIGSINQGLWTRLLVEYDGDEPKTKLAYIKIRAERLKAEANSKALISTAAAALEAADASQAEATAKERALVAQFQAEAREVEISEQKSWTVQNLGLSLKIERHER